MTELIIAYNWDGVALNEQDKARVKVAWLTNGDLSIGIDAPFANDPKPNCAKTACWQLWDFEVVELFLVGQGTPIPYTEIEISPWGNHLVLQLLGTRNVIAQELPLKIVDVKRGKTRWTAQAVISQDLLPKGELRVNAYRISGVEPKRHYHVMTPMAGPEPNFHHVEQFKTVLKRQN